MIRTVLGDIKKDSIRHALMHEHIECVSNDMLAAFGQRWRDAAHLEAYAARVLKATGERTGLDLFVDGTAIDLGRHARLLARVSKRSGISIVASTGFYYYPSMLTCQRSANDLAAWILQECNEGMEGTEIRPGILKCAADRFGVTEDTVKRLSAMATVQAKTGLPLYAHCSHDGTLAMEMADIFKKHGANPEKIVFGHASRRLDADYLSELVKQGYYICIDQCFDDADATNAARVVYELCQRGHSCKLLFSQDKPMYNDFAAPPHHGLEDAEEAIDRYSYVKEKMFCAFRKAGCSEKNMEGFSAQNALAVLDI